MIRAILVDDEKLALQLMEKKLTELGIQIIKTFTNAESVINEMKSLDFQVAFLDIELGGISGLDLAELIQEWNSQIHIVFITAYRDYAIQAFEIHSIDYLLKPVLKSRLEKTISRVQEQLQLKTVEPKLIEEKSSKSLRVICFNEFSVYQNEEPVKWKTAKVKELFAFFITHLNTYVNRDTIINTVWPEYDYNKAKIQLHTCISHLRKTLNTLGFTQSLFFSNQGYTLELDKFYCDAIEFERLIERGSIVNKDTISELENAIQLYIGDYMENNDYEWASTKTQSLREKLLQVLQKMINYYSKEKEYDKKRKYLNILIKYNPYSEHALRQLMLHYCEIGNRGDAIKVYHNFLSTLQTDLGILPDQTTLRLYETIING
ncbi:response regulator [Heyndrickxia sporothermodurans]